MRARALIFTLLLAALLVQAQAPAPIVSEREMLAALGSELAPAYAALEKDAHELRAAIVALCAERSSNAALREARTAWRVTAHRWRFVAAWPVGPLLERRSSRKFDFWPTRTPQIEAAVPQQAAGTLVLDKVGFSAQGLPALEYLLFDDSFGDAAPTTKTAAHCVYAELLAESFAGEAAALAVEWTAWTARWSQADAGELATAATGETLNVLVGTIERLRTRMLAKPAAAPAGATPAWDAWRSGATRDHLLATLAGVRRVLDGGQSGRGLLSLLRGRGQLALAARIDDRLQRAETALRALPAVLRLARSPSTAAAATAVGRLQATLSNDVAEVLRVTMGFNETDGD